MRGEKVWGEFLKEFPSLQTCGGDGTHEGHEEEAMGRGVSGRRV